MTELDQRIHAIRDDLVTAALQGQVDAPAYAEAIPAQVMVGHTPLRRNPAIDASLDSELLFGEQIDVFETSDDWCWVQNKTDGYVGYVTRDVLGELGEASPAPTHRVSALRSYLYPEPDLKTPPLDILSLTTALTIDNEVNGFGDTGHGWVWGGHLSAVDQFETNIVAVACSFIGTPYLWGGRTSIGLDCSAFVQLTLASCGLRVPRDTDMQENAMDLVNDWSGNADDLQSGDLIYWKGHVAIWLGHNRLIHANSTDMAVTSGPLHDIIEYIKQKTGEPVSSVRRPSFNI